MKDEIKYNQIECDTHHRAMQDTLDVLSRKWKLRIVDFLSFRKKRFMELIGHVQGIAAKMLSKELQELEMNGLVRRTVVKTKPITVEYELTIYGYSLKPIVEEMVKWGIQHRRQLKD